jgi:CRP-like cAMP-binding protein
VTIVDKLGDAKRRYDERRQAIEHFIGSYHIEDEGAEPMRAMIEFQWERTKFFDTEAVLAMLPTPLRLRVLMDMNKTFLFTVPFFQDCDEAVIKQIVQVLGHELVLPGTMIVHEGQPAEKMYFNRFGRFEMLAPHSYSIFHEVNVGDYFGEIGLLVTHGRYSATVRAAHDTRCEVATLDRKDLAKLMRTFPVFCQSFKAVGLQRLRKTRTAVLKSRYAGQTEYRMVLEIIRGHKIMGNIQECIITGEVVCRTSRSKRSTGVDENGNAIENSDSGEPMRASVQLGPVHRTERKRGTSPAFGNVFIVSICCHELQRLEDVEFELTMYQCHSWRPNSYIGSVIIYPSDVRLGQVVSSS